MTPEPERVLSVVCDILSRQAATMADAGARAELMRCRSAIAAVAGQFDRAVADRLTLLAEYEALLAGRVTEPAAGGLLVSAIVGLSGWQAGDVRPSRLEAELDQRRRQATALAEEPDTPVTQAAALRAQLYRDVSGQILLDPTW